MNAVKRLSVTLSPSLKLSCVPQIRKWDFMKVNNSYSMKNLPEVMNKDQKRILHNVPHTPLLIFNYNGVTFLISTLPKTLLQPIQIRSCHCI